MKPASKILFTVVLYALTSLPPLGGLRGACQDFHLSQYEASPQYLNPAMTGMFDGAYRFNAHYRNQWTNIANNPFTTTGVSFDMPYEDEEIGLGAYILNNRAGAGNYNVLTFVLSGAYDYQFSKQNPNHHLGGGLQLGFIHKSVNINNLEFENQYNNRNGGGFDPNISPGEGFENASIYLPEVNLGLTYFYADQQARINPFIGGSIFHLTQPRESFFGADNRLPRRYLLHSGTKFNVNEKIQVAAYYLSMWQLNARENTGTLMGYYYFRDADAFMLIGTTYRNKDAMIAHLGFKYKDFTYRFSYDFNISALNSVTRGRGGFELSVVYIMKKFDPTPIQMCPRLF